MVEDHKLALLVTIVYITVIYGPLPIINGYILVISMGLYIPSMGFYVLLPGKVPQVAAVYDIIEGNWVCVAGRKLSSKPGHVSASHFWSTLGTDGPMDATWEDLAQGSIASGLRTVPDWRSLC